MLYVGLWWLAHFCKQLVRSSLILSITSLILEALMIVVYGNCFQRQLGFNSTCVEDAAPVCVCYAFALSQNEGGTVPITNLLLFAGWSDSIAPGCCRREHWCYSNSDSRGMCFGQTRQGNRQKQRPVGWQSCQPVILRFQRESYGL